MRPTDLPSPSVVPRSSSSTVISFPPCPTIRATFSSSLLYPPLLRRPPLLSSPVAASRSRFGSSSSLLYLSLSIFLVLLHSPSVSRLVSPILPLSSRLPLTLSLPSFLPFRCSPFLSSLVLFLSSSLFRTRPLALSASRTNYLCLISDTVDAKR